MCLTVLLKVLSLPPSDTLHQARDSFRRFLLTTRPQPLTHILKPVAPVFQSNPWAQPFANLGYAQEAVCDARSLLLGSGVALPQSPRPTQGYGNWLRRTAVCRSPNRR
jgi:hypothetical protein